ncbi:hypothetical protein F5148DRAFT_1180214 [Russula earlei]|uniref:Uncharacterized protein n=1 Tax=Russula earlei TaxID=71964 RepID=A0ACC0UF46_9AGAM|nr:hypothetical protein F5148DRAFT_1180214 [Russula earlei]
MMGSASDYSSDSENDTPIAKRKKSTGAKSDNDDFSFKNVLRPPRSTTYTAQALYDQIVEGIIDLDPHYQRDVVWSEIKQIGLIDSVFRNFYIPPIIFAVSQSADGTERRVCIDGKQRLTSIQKFMDGLIYHKDDESKRKYWYKMKPGKVGKQLPTKYKRMFSNKQIVCIEYMEISEDDEREIFRRVQLGMALNYAEKMKAEAPTPRQSHVHELVAEFAMPLRSLGFNDRRDAGFRWIAQSLQTILDPRPFAKRTTTTTSQQTTWLKDSAPLDPAWKKRVQHTYQLLVDTLTAHPDCLRVTRGPATIAPIDLVMMILLVFEFQDKFSTPRLADALHDLRMAARKETKDLMWKSDHMGYYLVFLDRLEKQGEAALSMSSTQDGPVPMDVDPPAKRQRIGNYSPMPPPQSQPLVSPARAANTSQRIGTNASPSNPDLQSQQPPSSVPLRPMMTIPPSPSAAIESALTNLGSRPPPKLDRLAAVRAAKAAIQGGQQQKPPQMHGSHPLPPRPSQTQVARSGTGVNAESMSGSAGGDGPSGGEGRNRK